MKHTITLTFSVLVVAGLFALGFMPVVRAGEECSDATWSGEYVYVGSGTQLVDGVSRPVVLIGHLTADGKGTFVGRGTTSLNGVTSRRVFKATYTIRPDCSGEYDGETTEGIRFYGDTEIQSDGSEGVSIRTVPGQTINFTFKRSER